MKDIRDICIYCHQTIATTPIVRHEKTPSGMSYAIAGNRVLTEIGRRDCTSSEAGQKNNGQHLSMDNLAERNDESLIPA